jgi:CheY-like chemotaxis protein
VEARSEGPGRGSQFTVALPIRRPTAVPASPAAVPVRCPPSAVLLIEDNDDARQSLRSLLEQEGHRVDETSDGTSGLDRDATLRPDIVLIDIGLPGLDGYEVARRIRARRGRAPILVAITGYGQLEDQRRSLEAGFDAHLTKPVPPDQLTGLLGSLAHRRAGG